MDIVIMIHDLHTDTQTGERREERGGNLVLLFHGREDFFDLALRIFLPRRSRRVHSI
jgi:hypothetical protein